ncbi:1,2-phenylacetyl-CoA epoxidase subunit B [Streptomyces sp. NPDC015139]|uniref:1,2-phenylacetyl-CoA epoxidase subunit B n=1 Tax=Streptomyces sp. NPDC015139 TaxID=3364942 RepID=UPI0036F9DF4A
MIHALRDTVPSWEVFLRERRGFAHQHVGSVRAVDARTALEYARDLYARRGDPMSLWVVRSASVHVSSPSEQNSFFSNARQHILSRSPEYFTPLGLPGQNDDA